MKRELHLLAALAVVPLATGCAHPPRPAALAEADQVRGSPAVKHASAHAPQIVAHAESLRQKAQAAHDRGDTAAAGILAERAIVAYERAAVRARRIRAELQAAHADNAREQANATQQEIEAEKRRLEADIASLEQLIRVVKDAQPITPSPAGDHSREMARLKAARSIIVDARLLCSAASLLGDPPEPLEEAQKDVARLEDILAKWPKPAPIDDSLRARARCLSVLTLARRSGNQSTPADLVLAHLSNQSHLRPVRDDRGIVVTIRGDIERNDKAKSQVSSVANAATKFPGFPLLVVSHCRAKPSQTTTRTARQHAQQIVQALHSAGVQAKRIHTEHAGPHRPVAHDPLPPPPNSKNDRVEIVLVAPSL